MQQIFIPKLENQTISKKESLERASKLFQPLGVEKLNKNGEVEIENEKLKIKFNYVDLKFDVDKIPKNDEEFIGTNLGLRDRRLIKFLNFKPDLYSELKNFKIESKITQNRLDLNDYVGEIKVYVLKNGNDFSNSSADALNNWVKLNAEPKTIIGLLTFFHEIGHRNDPAINTPEAALSALGLLKKDKKIENQEMMDRERYAWAYSLSKLRPFLNEMDVDLEDLNTVIHKYALGTYSDYAKRDSE